MQKSTKIIDLAACVCYNKDMRSEKLSEIYRASGADVVYVTTDYLLRYLTGFYATDGAVLLDGERCRLIVDARYFEGAEKALWGTDITVVLRSAADTPESLLKDYKKVAIPFALTSYPEYAALKEQGYTLVDGMPALREAMMIKSREELALIQSACTIAEEAFRELLGEIKEGMTETEVAALLEYNMRRRGASGTSFDTICAFGEGGSIPHYETGDRKLRFGDPVLIDFGCKVSGYCSDITRTFLFGDDKKHEEFKKSYAEVLRAHELVKEKVVAGMTGREADAVARESLRRAGLAEAFTHSLGHGIGLNIHELPVLSPRGETVLRDGMVFSDEPGVYFPGKYGIRIEDSCFMEDGRVRSFMKLTEKNLVIL